MQIERHRTKENDKKEHLQKLREWIEVVGEVLENVLADIIHAKIGN